jgi:uncharacterized protein
VYGEMSEQEIDSLLTRNRFGRLGFVLDREVHIVPINYAWDGAYIYGHAAEGQKVRGMRLNPRVAFEVDEIDDPAHWRSVVTHGPYIEIREHAEKLSAFRKILKQAGGGQRSEATWALDLDHLVVFKIQAAERSGRQEQREAYELRPVPGGPQALTSGIPPRPAD